MNLTTPFTRSANENNWVGPLVVGAIKRNDLHQIIGLGLLKADFEPFKFSAQESNIVSVRRLRKCYARSDGRIISKVELPRTYNIKEWEHTRLKDIARQKISLRASKKANKNTKLPSDYFYIDKIIDSRNVEGKLHFLVKWADINDESFPNSWVNEDELLDKRLITEYFTNRFKLK